MSIHLLDRKRMCLGGSEHSRPSALSSDGPVVMNTFVSDVVLLCMNSYPRLVSG
jgi:hypothetical protein